MAEVFDDLVGQRAGLARMALRLEHLGEPGLDLDRPSSAAQFVVQLERPTVGSLRFGESSRLEGDPAEQGLSSGGLGRELGGGCGRDGLVDQRDGSVDVSGRVGHLGEHFDDLALALYVALLGEEAARLDEMSGRQVEPAGAEGGVPESLMRRGLTVEVVDLPGYLKGALECLRHVVVVVLRNGDQGQVVEHAVLSQAVAHRPLRT